MKNSISLKVLKPLNASSRGAVLFNRSFLSKYKPKKSLLRSVSATGGRNSAGRITVRHIGGGHKRRYRLIDFKRQRDEAAPGLIKTIEYDPYRNSYISLVEYSNNAFGYILSPSGVLIGDAVSSGADVEIAPGNALPLINIPIGTLVHNVELKPGKGGQIARSAGCSARIVAHDKKYTLLRLSSGESRYILSVCFATVGIVSNQGIKNVKLGKAGRKRWLGVRPTVRGVAMNPVDHPLGGGEGKTSGGRHPVSPWGLLTKGKKTRKMNKNSSKYIK